MTSCLYLVFSNLWKCFRKLQNSMVGKNVFFHYNYKIFNKSWLNFNTLVCFGSMANNQVLESCSINLRFLRDLHINVLFVCVISDFFSSKILITTHLVLCDCLSARIKKSNDCSVLIIFWKRLKIVFQFEIPIIFSRFIKNNNVMLSHNTVAGIIND